MKNLLIIIAVFATFSLNAQTEITWIGGTPGQETNWNQAKNWSTNQVPDEDTWVIIKATNSGHQALPVITSDIIIAGIEIQSNANLTIAQTGKLLIDGEMTYNYGILNVGKIINQGQVSVANTGLAPIYQPNTNIENHGSIAIFDQGSEVKYLAELD